MEEFRIDKSGSPPPAPPSVPDPPAEETSVGEVFGIIFLILLFLFAACIGVASRDAEFQKEQMNKKQVR
ncbi:MAG TPA: hypothetical protein VHR66_29880 [Gemmataceae bacterium]|jgi:hypothetical protein|nr:hypothetical protein [Gemmataceae bacterium]